MYMFKLRFLAPQCDHLPPEKLRVVDGASAALLHKDLLKDESAGVPGTILDVFV